MSDWPVIENACFMCGWEHPPRNHSNDGHPMALTPSQNTQRVSRNATPSSTHSGANERRGSQCQRFHPATIEVARAGRNPTRSMILSRTESDAPALNRGNRGISTRVGTSAVTKA